MKTSNKTSIGAISATIVTTIALFLSPVAKAADPLPLYSENFERASGGGNLPVSDFGWQAFSGSTAVNISTAGAPANSDIVAITPVAGNPGGLGALYSVNAATAGQTFAAVETFATGITIPETSTISWTMANASMDSKVRVLVQIGGMAPQAPALGMPPMRHSPVRKPTADLEILAALPRPRSHSISILPPTNPHGANSLSPPEPA